MTQTLGLAMGEVRRIVLPSGGASGRGWRARVTGGAVTAEVTGGAAPTLPPPGGLPPPSYSLDEVLVITGVAAGEAQVDAVLARPNGAPRDAGARRSFRVTVSQGPS
jgi:hypothetical protein